jgi:8-oxo-dGTP pyrophosphatase MutT (NUDIX family)
MQRRHYRAAGGVVLDRAGRVLLLEREVVRGDRRIREVRLPKGHIEAGETDEQAALREVHEESGYGSLRVLLDLGRADVSFTSMGDDVTRTDHYYLMRLLSDQRGTPTASGEEALFVPLWVADLATAERTLTYESERVYVQRARQAFHLIDPRDDA